MSKVVAFLKQKKGQRKSVGPTEVVLGNREYVPPPVEDRNLKNFSNETESHDAGIRDLKTFNHPEMKVDMSDYDVTGFPGINQTGIYNIRGTHEKVFMKRVKDTEEAYREAAVPYVAKHFGIQHMTVPVAVHDFNPGVHAILSPVLTDHHGLRDVEMTDPQIERNYQEGIKKSAMKGDLARAAVMNYILSNMDRHGGNYMSHPDTGVKLIDHGLVGYNPMEMQLHYLGAAGKEPLNLDLDSYINALPINEIRKVTNRFANDDSDYDIDNRLKMLKKRLDRVRDKNGKIPGTLTHAALREALK